MERMARPLTVIPTQVGIQRGDEGAEGTALACILLIPQAGLVAENNYNIVLELYLSEFTPSRE